MRISCTHFIVKTVQIQRSAFFESMGHTMRISCTHFVVKIVQIPRSVGLTAMGHTSVFPIAGKTISGRSCAIFTIKYYKIFGRLNNLCYICSVKE